MQSGGRRWTSSDGLDALVDQSLLRPVEGPDGEPRFAMLETIREYGLERLAASGEAEATRRAHAEFFLALAEEAEPRADRAGAGGVAGAARGRARQPAGRVGLGARRRTRR